MEGFKVVCNKCGEEAQILSNEDWNALNIESDKIKFDLLPDATLYSISCDCGNKVQ